MHIATSYLSNICDLTCDLATHFIHQGTLLPQELTFRLSLNMMQSFFQTARVHSQSNSSPSPSSLKTLAQHLYSREESSLYDELENEEEMGWASSLMGSLDGWTGGDLNDVSFRWW